MFDKTSRQYSDVFEQGSILRLEESADPLEPLPEVSAVLGNVDRAALERTQVFTPPKLAEMMASILSVGTAPIEHLLDPGAGTGALTEAVLDRGQAPLAITMVEQDPLLANHLRDEHTSHGPFSGVATTNILHADFLRVATAWRKSSVRFSHVIMNPPYSRIPSGSTAKKAIAEAGINAPNLFAAFLWAGVDVLAPGGRLVAVVPRSLLSGLQFRATRERILLDCSVYRLHHFASRKGVFDRDAVQQEVVVIGLVKSGLIREIEFSRSEDLNDFRADASIAVPTTRMLTTRADDSVVLVPTDVVSASVRRAHGDRVIPSHIRVSVGSVVDFRQIGHIATGLNGMPSTSREAYVPLVGSEMFSAIPKQHRWLRSGPETEKHIFPPGHYLVIKRISPPEMRPRLKASLLDATTGSFEHGVAFENHVLVLHQERSGLEPEVGAVLLDRLTSISVQSQIAERSGSTQINALDVASLRVETSQD